MENSKKVSFDEDDVQYMTDLLLETSMSLTDIAKELNCSISFLNKKINQYGLSWLKTSHKKMSRGQSALTLIMQKLLPNEEIVNEYHLGDRLKLDVYCPKYKIGAEYHGRQHFYFTGRFFSSKEEFEESIKRDEKKIERCKELGIALIVFRYNDKLTEDSVYDRIIQAIRESPVDTTTKIKKPSISQNNYYQERKKRYNDSKKKRYKELKKKNDRRRKNK
jgi:hypothetical protein